MNTNNWRDDFRKLWKNSWRDADQMGHGFVSDEVEEYFIGSLPVFEVFVAKSREEAKEEARGELYKEALTIKKWHEDRDNPIGAAFAEVMAMVRIKSLSPTSDTK